MPIVASPQRVSPASPLHSTAYRRPSKALTFRSKVRGLHKRASSSRMYAASAVSAEVAEDTYTWTGEDEFDKLNDRVDAPPLPLPPIREARRVALVRHGQSTWNAQGRVQGSSNISYLTKKGESQAETTQQMVGPSQLNLVMSVCTQGLRTPYHEAPLTSPSWRQQCVKVKCPRLARGMLT